MNALVPLTGRLAALKTVALQASGTPLHDPAAGKASFRTASEDTENWIENRLRAYPSEKALFANFRQSLGRIVAASGKPAVIVLDELDRCAAHRSPSAFWNVSGTISTCPIWYSFCR